MGMKYCLYYIKDGCFKGAWEVFNTETTERFGLYESHQEAKSIKNILNAQEKSELEKKTNGLKRRVR
ncbi:MAG: hypothetical protein LBV16_08235 [Elusimicrobiota bacterium]|jgi:hypothetical protein|nr:hypothetical protein [Elusimicrobiota bacterium]